MEELKILICSQNDAVCARAERYLALWRETFCVRCAAERLDWEALPAREGAICFLDLTGAAANGNEPQNAATVVIAANDAQAIESYRHHPAAFLPDGFGYAEFCEAMGKCYPFWRQHLQWLELSFHRRPVRLPLCQLRYAEADGRETVLHCDGVTMRGSAPLGKVAEQLPSPLFLRCQKSFLVNLASVREVSRGSVILADGRSIPLARARSQELTRAVAAWNAARETEVSVT